MLILNLKRLRVKWAIIYFPICLVVFSAILTLVVWVKGHFFIEILEEILGATVSHQQFVIGLIGLLVLITAAALIYFIKQDYLDCRCHDYHFCPTCNAVDNYDEGVCHICAATLTDKASFFYTTDKKEIAALQRIGLPIFKEAKQLTVSTADE